jgi:hypothetical protein
MRNAFKAVAKSLVIGSTLVIFMALSHGVARADTVAITGITLGSFSGGFSSNPTLLGLTFNGTSFPNTIGTVDTNAASFFVAGPNIHLGSFTLTGAPATYTGNTFALQLTFTFPAPPVPLLITGASQPSFTSTLTGTVQSLADGSVTIDFDNAPSVFTVLLDGVQIGTFSITVNDIVIQPGQTVNVVGNAVPEPATLLMLSTGLAVIGTAYRKRRKTTN